MDTPIACKFGLHLWELTIPEGELQPHEECARCGAERHWVDKENS